MSTARANGITIEYESLGADDAPALLLIMGLGMQLHGWPDEFCQLLVERGYRVIRYDNRDSGLSTQVVPRKPVRLPLALLAASIGLPVSAPYRLDDMAADAAGLLDALGIERAHVVGASMGGMIAQVMAARHPERVRTLVSIMSSSGNRRVSRSKPAAARALLGRPADPGDEQAVVEHLVQVYGVIGSPAYRPDPVLLRQRIARSVRRAYRPQGTARQLLAIVASGDRRKLLARITAPTLVIHGAEDPLVPLAAGRDTARHIAGAKLMVIDGMGHDLPAPLFPRLVEAIAGHCR